MKVVIVLLFVTPLSCKEMSRIFLAEVSFRRFSISSSRELEGLSVTKQSSPKSPRSTEDMVTFYKVSMQFVVSSKSLDLTNRCDPLLCHADIRAADVI